MFTLIKTFFHITYNWSYIKFMIIMALNIFVFVFEFLSIVSVIPLISIIFENSINTSDNLVYFFKFYNFFFSELNIRNLVIFTIFLSISKFFIHTLSTYLQDKFILMSTKKIQSNILSNLIKSKYAYLIKLKTSSISNYIFPEISRVRISCISLNKILYNIKSVLIFFIGSLFINIYFSMISLAIGIFYFFLLSPINFFYAKQGKIQRNTRNSILYKIQIFFNNFKNFKIINKNFIFIDQISNTIEKLYKSELRTALFKSIIKNLSEPLLIIIVLVLINHFSSSISSIKISEIGALFLIFSRIFSRFSVLVQSMNNIFQGKSSLEAIRKQEIDSFENREKFFGKDVLKINEIEFANCSFSYAKKNIFSNLNFKLSKGQICSIYGASGAGKTTLADLLVGFNKITDGKILINGENLNEYNLISLREKIGYVTQDSYLLNGSIRYNILLNENKKQDEEICHVLSLLELNNLFIDNKIDLEKNIYDKALNISGGQKQRLLIARELLKKPDILIFDETLSQLHKEIRIKIFRIIKSLRSGIMIINLTHNDEFKSMSDKVLII